GRLEDVNMTVTEFPDPDPNFANYAITMRALRTSRGSKVVWYGTPAVSTARWWLDFLNSSLGVIWRAHFGDFPLDCTDVRAMTWSSAGTIFHPLRLPRWTNLWAN